jgi:hypothetical protein
MVCFATGVMQIKSNASEQMNGNNWAMVFDDSAALVATGYYINSM